MELKCENRGDIRVVHVAGRIDGSNADAFGLALRDMSGGGNHHLLIDMGAVPYINSAGLRAVLAAAKNQQKHDERCVICGLSGEVREIFDLAGFLNILQVYPSVEEAISHW